MREWAWSKKSGGGGSVPTEKKGGRGFRAVIFIMYNNNINNNYYLYIYKVRDEFDGWLMFADWLAGRLCRHWSE